MPQTAYFIIPEDMDHGEELICSYPRCRNAGIKFRYCKQCRIPVAKRNFRDRHRHGFGEVCALPGDDDESLARVAGTGTGGGLSEGGDRVVPTAAGDSRGGGVVADEAVAVGGTAPAPSNPGNEDDPIVANDSSSSTDDGRKGGGGSGGAGRRGGIPHIPVGADPPTPDGGSAPSPRPVPSGGRSAGDSGSDPPHQPPSVRSVTVVSSSGETSSDAGNGSGSGSGDNGRGGGGGGGADVDDVGERERRWASLLISRPKTGNSGGMSAWLLDVLSISDMGKPLEPPSSGGVVECGVSSSVTRRKEKRGFVPAEDSLSGNSDKRVRSA